MPVIRVDDQVWAWLQSQGRVFEDTPNSVLRRLAGLSPTTASDQSRPVASEPARRHIVKTQAPLGNRVTGDSLNRQHRLGARHALYHKDGTFYERLTAFPAVYCDPHGYVKYDSEQSFKADRHIRIGEKVNIPGTLGGHPKYRTFPS